jgi:DNA-binding NarL/FixJ family response regulator
VIGTLLADDHPLVLNALVACFAERDDIVVVATARSGPELLELYRANADRVDVVLSDLSMPGSPSGPELVRALVALVPEPRVVVFTANDDTTTIADCIDAGAIGFVSKQADQDELFACLLDAAEGRPAFDALTAPKVIPALRAARRAVRLSPRELQVLREMAEGHTNVEIGDRLFVSPLTVKTHVTRILTKLEVKDRGAAVAKGFRDGLLR